MKTEVEKGLASHSSNNIIVYTCIYIYIYIHIFVSPFEIINIPCTQGDRIHIYIYICKPIWWEFIEHIFDMLFKIINSCQIFTIFKAPFFKTINGRLWQIYLLKIDTINKCVTSYFDVCFLYFWGYFPLKFLQTCVLKDSVFTCFYN